MSDIYKIGIAIMLTQNGVAPALSLISHQLLGVHRSVNQINSGFGRWRTALVGAAGVMAGTGLLGGLAKIASYGEKFLDQQAQLRNLGRTNQEIAEATAKAWENTRIAPGSSVAENLKSIGELFSIVGIKEALATSGKFAQLDQLLHQTTGKEGSAYTTARAGELLGVFQDKKSGEFDITGFNKFMDMVGRSTIASHGKVTPADWLAYAKQAGPAAGNLTEDGFLTTNAIIQAMGGFRAGTAAASLNRQFAGGIMSQRVAKELMRIGVAQDGDFEIGKGGQVLAKTGAMSDMVNALQKDPLSAISEILLPKLQAAGFDTNEKLSAEIYKMIGTGPAQRQVYELIRGRNQIAQERERAKQTLGIGDATGNLNANSPIAAKSATMAAFNNMMTALGSEGLRAAIPLMLAATDFFNNVGKFAVAHPTAMKVIGEGLVVLGVALTVAGGLAILAAFGPVGWIALGIGALGVAILNFKSIFSWFVGAFESLFGKKNTNGAWDAGSTPVTEGENGAAFGVYRKWGRHSVEPPALGTGAKDMTGTVWMDGAKVGEIVTGHQVNAAAGAIQGPAYFDYARAGAANDSSWANP